MVDGDWTFLEDEVEMAWIRQAAQSNARNMATEDLYQELLIWYATNPTSHAFLFHQAKRIDKGERVFGERNKPSGVSLRDDGNYGA